MDQSGRRSFGYFDEIVGLRIYLALWVAIGHGMQLSGYILPQNLISKIILNGNAAVVIFMIVSGFVITNLLLKKQERYSRYLLRRFFRLYPAYVVAAVLGYFVSGSWTYIVKSAPYSHTPGWADYAASVVQLRYEVVHRLWAHVLLHATMLHGAVPNEVLPRASMTILPAAWSISLEWQYYLIAPAVLMMTQRPRGLLAASTIALTMFILYTKGGLGSYSIGSNLAGCTPYFALGIASRLGYPALSRMRVDPLAAALVVAFTALTMLRDPLPILVWGVFLSFSLWRDGRPVLAKVYAKALMSRPAMLFGEASYSLYLIHRPLQVAFGAWAMAVIRPGRIEMFGVQMAAVAVAIPVSVGMYFCLEKPLMRLGARIANRMGGEPVMLEPAPVTL